MQSLYSEQRTWLHAWPAGLKLLTLSAAGSLLFLTDLPAVLLVAATICAGCFVSLGRAAAGTSRLLLPVLAAALLVAVFHAFMGHAMLGLGSAARLLAMALLGFSLTLTTRYTELLEVLEWMLSPLSRAGVRVDRLSLQIALMMHFTEHFFLQWKRLDDAHRVRTGRPGGWRLLAPLTIQMLIVARRLADTLQVRLRD